MYDTMQVGSEVARRGTGLGFANVIAYDPYASEVKAAALGVKLVSWEEALAQADFLSLHMPQTPQTKVHLLPMTLNGPQTHHMISEDLSAMRNSRQGAGPSCAGMAVCIWIQFIAPRPALICANRVERR